MKKKNIVILGCTGSIGDSSLKVIRHLKGQFNIIGVAGGRRFQKVADFAAETNSRYASISDESSFDEFQKSLPKNCEALIGEEGMIKMCTDPHVDMVLCGIVGTAGLAPVLEAIRAGKDIALASKEILVMAGEMVMKEVKKHGVAMIPVDSEHNAIFQCLEAQGKGKFTRLLLTCSGGPFRQTTKEEFKNITLAQALRHPTWTMGPKITIDSATLMNKSLEVIEAAWLFGADIDQVEVVIHPQSIVHSMVEFNDGSTLAQLSSPDMVFPIQYALTYPQRYDSNMKPLDFASGINLSFEGPDHDRFPSISMAKEAFKRGGTSCAVFNAANEVAVASFLDEKLKFLDIWNVIRHTLDTHTFIQKPTLDEIIASDQEARVIATKFVSSPK
ncbi:MAG: 1-deoxy-D-xylulose-5-phosphate reductoisomerase [Lentisphaeraceae bacterium]|nr:1-deoxy-D-xylulose-5-phosphate reductoisomerase [Lentisphaeraceae bacterium]